MKMKGAEALIESLKREGVEVIFGYPGGAALPIYDALFDCECIRHILVRHEQGAAHAAEGYAKATGRVGVCLATSGPGATNLVTGLTDAYMDSVPVVAITGQVATPYIGKDAFQEADVFGITMHITKHNYLVKNPEDLPRVVAEAFYIARTGRPGPVLIDIPRDVSAATIDYEPVTQVQLRSYKPTVEGHPRQIAKAAELIQQSERPILYIGGGVISGNASAEVLELAEKANLPVVYTLMGKGAVPDDHPLCLGMLGMHGSAYANYAVAYCDTLIAIGARFDDRVTGKVDAFAPHAKIIHIDIDPAEIGKVKIPLVPVVGDCKRIVPEITKLVSYKPRSEWLDQINRWRQEFPLDYPHDEELRAEFVIERISALTNGEAIVTTDVGQHQMWAAQFFKCKFPRQFITSGGLGTMGFGLPAAIGAQIGCPDREVWCISGDGSIQMCSQELMTAVQCRLPIRIAIINNEFLGMVRQWQELFWNRRYSHVELAAAPDFVKLAEAYGAVGLRVEQREDVDTAIKRAREVTDVPVVIDFRVAREINVFPMIPSGGTIEQMKVRQQISAELPRAIAGQPNNGETNAVQVTSTSKEKS